MKVGSIVELINNNWGTLDDFMIYPVKGVRYIVREILDCSGGPAILLEEIVNKKRVLYEGFLEPAFKMSRFRELLGPIEDIEEFIHNNSLELIDL